MALQTLRKKAEEKNPDEFYFGMQNVQTREGVHVKECSPSRSLNTRT